jgi:hypothetical protein
MNLSLARPKRAGKAFQATLDAMAHEITQP